MDKNLPNNADFQSQLPLLKERLLAMGGEVEEQVRSAVRSLVDRDIDLAEKTLLGDGSINSLHIEIDKLCFDLIASNLPSQEDVRIVISGVKINNDLERIGDVAVKISESTLRYLQHPPVKPLIDIPRMADLSQSMLRDSLNSYVRHSTSLGTEVVSRDVLVDELQVNVRRDLVGAMLEKSETIEPALDLLLISRYVGQISDHAASIAEEVIFMVSGRDIRHQRKESFTGS